MPRLQAFKFELMPDGDQARAMCRFAGARRFVFSQALALQQARYSEGQKKLSYADLCKHLTAWRHSAQAPWLAQILRRCCSNRSKTWSGLRNCQIITFTSSSLSGSITAWPITNS